MTRLKPVSWVVVLVVAWVCVLESSRASARFQAVRETAVGAEDELSFERFRAVFGKAYGSSAAEAEARQHFGVHVASLRDVRARNPLGVFEWQTWFDQPEATVRSRYLGNPEFFAKAVKDRQNAPPERFLESSAYPQEDSAPPSKDWRAEGAVTPVKEQGHCGSCWAFSAVGAMEGQWAIAGYPLTRFSEQMLVSCDEYDFGCTGGVMDSAFNWMKAKTRGFIATEASYPYVSGQGQVPECDMTNVTWGGYISDFQFLDANEDLIAAFLGQHGPLPVAVDATDFVYYAGGVLTNATSIELSHAVLLVGYNNTHSPPYWIIKNSWGPGWGEEGYIRIEKGKNAALITEYATAMILNKDNPPSPPSPSTTTTTTTTAAPSIQHLTLYTCANTGCNKGCIRSAQWPTNVCIPGQTLNDPSTELSCVDNVVFRRVFTTPHDLTCAGTFKSEMMSLDDCFVTQTGSAFYSCE